MTTTGSMSRPKEKPRAYRFQGNSWATLQEEEGRKQSQKGKTPWKEGGTWRREKRPGASSWERQRGIRTRGGEPGRTKQKRQEAMGQKETDEPQSCLRQGTGPRRERIGTRGPGCTAWGVPTQLNPDLQRGGPNRDRPSGAPNQGSSAKSVAGRRPIEEGGIVSSHPAAGTALAGI